MVTGAVGGIDIIVKKKPGGHMTTIQLVDTGNGNLRVTNIMGGDVADHQRLRQISGLVGALLTGTLTTVNAVNAALNFGQVSATTGKPVKGVGVGLGKPGDPGSK
jgi:hypothetical protein